MELLRCKRQIFLKSAMQLQRVKRKAPFLVCSAIHFPDNPMTVHAPLDFSSLPYVKMVKRELGSGSK